MVDEKALTPAALKKAHKADLEALAKELGLDDTGTAAELRDRILHSERHKRKAMLKPHEVHVYTLEGEVARNVVLPLAFSEPVRLDLVQRAVRAAQANRRQPYGPSPTAGIRHSVEWAGKGRGVSRVPRIRGTMRGAFAPGTVTGRRAHPPRVDRDWSQKVNRKERRKARRSALAALQHADLVMARGHRFKEGLTLPIVVEDALEALEVEEHKVKEAVGFLEHLGVYDDVVRAKEGTHIRAGRGKMRGRRYRHPRSLLVVVGDASKVRPFLGNLPGVDVATPKDLNVELLAPGGQPGRLTIFTEGALKALEAW